MALKPPVSFSNSIMEAFTYRLHLEVLTLLRKVDDLENYEAVDLLVFHFNHSV